MNDSIFTKLKSPYREKSAISSLIELISEGIGVQRRLEIPNATTLLNHNSRLSDILLNHYEETVSYKEYGEINVDVKLMQSSLLTGFMYGYHRGTKEISLYTGDPSVIGEFDPDNSLKFNVKSTAKLNSIGELNAIKINCLYDEPTGFQPFISSTRRLIIDDYIFFPIESAVLMAQVIGDLLSKGKVLLVKDTVRNSETYLITQNASVLKRYSDNAEYVAEISKKRYTQLGKHTMFVPILGETSDKYGLKAIDLLSINHISIVEDDGKLIQTNSFKGNGKKAAVSLIKRELQKQHEIISIQHSVDSDRQYNTSLDKLADIMTPSLFLEKLNEITVPNVENTRINLPLSTAYSLIDYLDDRGLKEFWEYMKSQNGDWVNELKLQEMTILTSNTWEIQPPPTNQETLYDMLNNGILRITHTTNDGEYIVEYLTTSFDILSKVYGDEHIRKYETISVWANRDKTRENMLEGRKLFAYQAEDGDIFDYYSSINIDSIQEVVKVF